ncbi:MAG: metallophosphoesterase [Clostridia bacterium]|nr:metallophosphoesterase [Clostridia bacterium]
MQTTIRPIEFAPGSRVIVISDIHGHPALLQRLLTRVCYRTGVDYLILLGDLIEKGPDSLGVIHMAMDLSSASDRVAVTMGNNDLWRLEQLIEPTYERDNILFSTTQTFARYWGSSLFAEMCRAIGADCTDRDMLPSVRESVCETFADELNFLASLPTVLVGERHIFVHGGIPCPEEELLSLTDKNAYCCLKYDNFLGDLTERKMCFSRWVIAGHWPATLYRAAIPSHDPLISPIHHVVSIDGGCGLKREGQLNALIFDPADDAFTSTYVDDLPLIRALDDQPASTDSISIHWGDNAVSLLENAPPRTGYHAIEHLRTGRRLYIPEGDLYTDGGELFCQDCTDYQLPVAAGEPLSLVKTTPDAAIVKRGSVVGWYHGRYEY